jgi:hypothetical protein
VPITAASRGAARAAWPCLHSHSTNRRLASARNARGRFAGSLRLADGMAHLLAALSVAAGRNAHVVVTFEGRATAHRSSQLESWQ